MSPGDLAQRINCNSRKLPRSLGPLEQPPPVLRGDLDEIAIAVREFES
jgi:hypothetical protein